MNRARTCTLESGSKTVNPSDRNYCGADGFRGLKEEKIEFAKPFTTAPVVMLSITRLDIIVDDPRKGVRAVTEIVNESVTEKDFKLNAGTWCDTRMPQLKVSWIAVGK